MRVRYKEDKTRRKLPPNLPCPHDLIITLAGSPSPKRTSHILLFPEKDKPVNKKVKLYSSVNVISVLSKDVEAEQRGNIRIPHSLHEPQLFCISQ